PSQPHPSLPYAAKPPQADNVPAHTPASPQSQIEIAKSRHPDHPRLTIAFPNLSRTAPPADSFSAFPFRCRSSLLPPPPRYRRVGATPPLASCARPQSPAAAAPPAAIPRPPRENRLAATKSRPAYTAHPLVAD